MKDKYKLTKNQSKMLKLSIIIISILFVGTILLAINVLGSNTKNFKDKDVKIKNKDNNGKFVHIEDITKTDNDLVITLNQSGYTMFELAQIKIASEDILKEKTLGKTTFK